MKFFQRFLFAMEIGLFKFFKRRPLRFYQKSVILILKTDVLNMRALRAKGPKYLPTFAVL